MKVFASWTGLVLIAASSSAAAPKFVPAAAKIELSGFATIESAPPSPFPDQLPPPENRPKDERGFYAQMAGISDEEAAKRLAEQEAARPEFERMLAVLRRREAGNFTDARLVHKPDWAFVLYFKRDPDRTLAKYTRNLHFRAAQARYSTAELQALAKPWVDRFMAHRLLAGHGTDATFGEVGIDLTVSEAEFQSIAQREGWGTPPDAIKLNFSDAPQGETMSEQVRPLVRIFPQSDRSLGATNQALLSGRIVLRDGCFYVTGPNKPDRLAYFPREVALALDKQGYLSLRTRGPNPKHRGRIGEMFGWGGPIGIEENAPMVRELRAQCGSAPLQHVGMAESSRLFQIRPWVVDAIAERRRISRDEAWRRFKACIEEAEKRRAGAMLQCNTL